MSLTTIVVAIGVLFVWVKYFASTKNKTKVMNWLSGLELFAREDIEETFKAKAPPRTRDEFENALLELDKTVEGVYEVPPETLEILVSMGMETSLLALVKYNHGEERIINIAQEWAILVNN